MDLISTYKNNNSSRTLLSKNNDENYRTFFALMQIYLQDSLKVKTNKQFYTLLFLF